MNQRKKQPTGSARERARQQQELAARRKKERTILIAAVLALVLLVGGGIGVQYWRTNRAPSADTPPESVEFAPVTVEEEKPVVLGAAGAPVTLTVFADFHCPHCVEFEEMFGETISAEQRAGRVALEVYPMAFIDEGSLNAANAFACAGEAGFGQPYHDGLFANASLGWSSEQLIDLADQLDVDAGQEFETCVSGMEHQSWVESMDAAAEAQGVTGTPSVFLDGESVSLDGLSPEDLKAQIDAAVQK